MGKKILKIVLIVVIAIVVLLAGFVLLLTFTEYKPDDQEDIAVEASASGDSENLSVGDSLTVMTWNMGYGALGDNADFFMDGGEHATTATEDRVNENLEGIAAEIASVDPDVLFLQECDRKSTRSYKVDEYQFLKDGMSDYQSTFATNYKVLYIPYPLFDNMGSVNCGIATFSKLGINESTRIQLPCPFSWPYRLVNLKRCIMVDRMQLEGTDKELVMVNLHLEAYDDGEGKAAQTAMLREILDEEYAKGNYVIAGGDFNQKFSNVDSSKFPRISDEMWDPAIVEESDFDDSWQFVMDSDQASCRSLDRPLEGNDTDPESFQYYQIDGFIVSGNITVNSSGIDDQQFKNSDHNPLVMNVTLN